MSAVRNFLADIESIFATGSATEHSYRPAIKTMIEEIGDNVRAINEPKREACGAPDFAIYRDDIAIAHIEAKDVVVGLDDLNPQNKSQKRRYLKALPNLLYTNGLDFEFYRDGITKPIAKISIGNIDRKKIVADASQFDELERLLRDFLAQSPQTIRSAEKLADHMAGKAVLMKDVFARALLKDEDQSSELFMQYKAFAEMLIHDISVEDFADIYAETIAYGMFAARLHDTTLDSFSRVEALELLPKSNPFLRKLFEFVAGSDLDEGIRWIVDDLASVFKAADVGLIMKDFGKLSGRKDPFLHFYETFLKAYNPKKRQARGVWYTPEAVVNFIVRAMDDVLQSEFGLSDGLADTSKITIDWDTGQKETLKSGKLAKSGKNTTIKKQVHKVQILDPATGTGTFLAEVIKLLSSKIGKVAPGLWSSYVEADLIPRLHGFELLMASYAMCHMKLEMILTELGYKPTASAPRMSVFLTNALEEGDPADRTLPFASWLAEEAKQANAIKRDMPIMCILGNPPYSGESANKNPWIDGLLDDYKKEPGGKTKLNERNPKWINDDYVKFIRMSEALIEKNGEGVLGFITNHGYLSNPTFRGMRWHLRKTFDKIWVIDLHGNSKKKERVPDGKTDKNVFDIQQGVAIIIAVRKKQAANSKPLAQVFHADLWGSRAEKYEALFKSSIKSISWQELTPDQKYEMFYPVSSAALEKYNTGFELAEVMTTYSIGIATARDALTIDIDRSVLEARVSDFSTLSEAEAREKYNLGADTRDWKVKDAQKDVRANFGPDSIKPIDYRPFDTRWTLYTGQSRGFHCYPRAEVSSAMLGGDNLALMFTRTIEGGRAFADALVTKHLMTLHSLSTKEVNYFAPLHVDDPLDGSRRANFEPKFLKKLQTIAMKSDERKPTEIEAFDYIYGVLHAPIYREVFDEVLKIDFPRIPWPSDAEEFWDVSAKGAHLRQLHLMDSSLIGDTPYPFNGEGDNAISAPPFPKYEDEKVWINETQHFSDVPLVAWHFFVGGYQPAQKWLKDRAGRQISFADIKHYQKIIKVLHETHNVMQTIKMKLG